MIYTSNDAMRRRADEIDTANWEADKADCARRMAMATKAGDKSLKKCVHEYRRRLIVGGDEHAWCDAADAPCRDKCGEDCPEYRAAKEAQA